MKHSHWLLTACALTLICSSLKGVFNNNDWVEAPTPIYTPYSTPLASGEDFFEWVVFDKHKFHGSGDEVFYKMWHQGPNGIAISYSSDGINWILKGDTNITTAYHPCVLYDKNGFGGGAYNYKMWYWNGSVGTTADVIKFTQSTDGLTWTTPVSVAQDAGAPIVFGASGTYFYHLYGPGFIIYNPAPTSTVGDPYSFRYVMFYDIASETPIPSVEGIGLAYSDDGLTWSRYGSAPVLLPAGGATTWDGTHAFRPSVIQAAGVYHMFYSGSNEDIDPSTTVVYAHGIGHATSTDGLTWTKDPQNPIFIYSDGVSWRNSRTYTPFVLYGRFPGTIHTPGCGPSIAKMWFTGGTGLVQGANESVGYATLPCPLKAGEAN